MTRSEAIARLERRMIARTVESDDGDAIFDAFCRDLVEAGLPLWRASIASPTIDPLFRAATLEWWRGGGTTLVATEHGSAGEAVFARSPIQALLEADRKEGRWRLDDGQALGETRLLAELRAAGGTDYVLHLHSFAPGTALMGAAVSFATDRAGGFRADELAVLAALAPAVALVSAKLVLAHTLREVLGTYLGASTGARVLEGRIRRGQGEVVSAAILLVDLRGFTALADRDDPLSVVGWLDEHLDALGEPVARHGGEISKFLGDGFLAVFPVSDPEARPCTVCARALAAAREALARNGGLNAARRAADRPALAADAVLHFGQVVYGNVGTGRRLDFTVIGRAVNEASRIEALCGEIGRPLLLSDAFAQRCNESLTEIGSFPLRGVERPQRVWAPAA